MRILRRIVETCCLSDSSERPSANSGVKNLQVVIYNNNNNNNNDNAKRTDYIKAKIDNTQLCRFCGDIDETINPILSEYSKLAQREYKTRHDWVGKMIHTEMIQETEIRSYYQMVYAQTRICPDE